jgi:hypothetical protein
MDYMNGPYRAAWCEPVPRPRASPAGPASPWAVGSGLSGRGSKFGDGLPHAQPTQKSARVASGAVFVEGMDAADVLRG